MLDGETQRQVLQQQVQQMQGTVNRIQSLSDRYWGVLDAPCRTMEDRTWFGPKGREFDHSVHADRAQLRVALSKAVQLAQGKLADLRAQLRAM